MNLDNPNFERPIKIMRENGRFSIENNRFTGQKSYDGFVGGPPLAYDRETGCVAVDNSDNHTLVYGATGSKKTRCIVQPTIRILGCAGEDMVINDPKGELHRTMAGFLERQGYNVVTFNFRDPSTGHAWNFLQIPYRFYKEGNIDKACEFIEDVANAITTDVGTSDSFWKDSAASCIYGLTLVLFRYCKEHSLPDGAVNIANLLKLRRVMFSNGSRDKNSKIWEWAKEDELIAASLIGTVETAPDTKNGVLSTLDQALRCFSVSPALVDMLSNNNFELGDIAKGKTAVFLVTPDEKTTYHRLVALFISQSYQQLVQQADHSSGKLENRVNFILDEFSSLPTIGGADMAQYLAAGRSRNLRFLLCLQSKNQLVQTYRKNAETITANCTNWIFLFSRELDLLKELSALCGEKRDNTPNLSVYDLQQLDKDQNQALLLSARRKPAIVNLLDIDGYARKSPRCSIRTPERESRIRLDFADLSGLVQPKPLFQMEMPRNLASNVDEITGKKDVGRFRKESGELDLDAMLKDIDEKIKLLDEAEEQEKVQKNEGKELPAGDDTESEE